jgi:hypothetical protein
MSSSSTHEKTCEIIFEEDECVNKKYTTYVLNELHEFKDSVAKVPVQ